MRNHLSIDWRAPHAKLKPHIDGAGGVVYVKGGKKAGLSIFADILRQNWLPEAETFPWITYTVDPRDFNVRYTNDLVREIAEYTLINLPKPKKSANVHIEVAKNIRTNSFNLTNVPISTHPRRDFDQERAELDALCDGLRKFLLKSRFALIFTEAHDLDKGHQKDLKREIWDRKFERLIDDGLLLIVLLDSSKEEGKDKEFPPPPHLIIELPEFLPQEGHDDRTAALHDLVRFAMHNSWYQTEKEAYAFAETLMDCSDSMSDLHARFSGVRGRRGVTHA